MKKIIILLIFLLFSINISYGENTKNIDGMYLSDGYYIGKIKGIDLKEGTVEFDNYIRFYGKDSIITDLIDSDYRQYIFSKGLIDYFYMLENRKFLKENINEKYVIFYVNNYRENFIESLKNEEVNLKYLSFIKCDKKGKIYFNTNGYKVFPMGGTEENVDYIKEKLGKLNSCKELEKFFSSDKRFNFSLEKQTDYRLYYFLLITITIILLFGVYKIIGKINKKYLQKNKKNIK